MAFKAGKSKFSGRGPVRSLGRNSDRSSGFGEKPRFGNKPRPFGKPSARPAGKFELFDLKCDKCGKDCQVPFKPTSGKPVYCRDCFAKKGDTGSRNDASRSEELAEIHEKLDKIMRALGIDEE